MYSTRLTAAFELASRSHAIQTRKGIESPYLSHLLGVASLVIEHGGTEALVIAALLHDAVEDCGGQPMLDEIRSQFGDEVALTVLQCSDSIGEVAGNKLDWEDRKRAYVAAVRSKSPEARFVTACDKLHNATAILNDHRDGASIDGSTVWDRFSGKTPGQTIAYYTAMVDALKGTIPDALWRRLDAIVAALVEVVDADEHGRWLVRLRSAA